MQSASTSGNGQNSPIARDIQNVVTDAQELLKTVQSEGQTKLTEVKGQVQAKPDNAKVRLVSLARRCRTTRSRRWTPPTHDNPWRAGHQRGRGCASSIPDPAVRGARWTANRPALSVT